MQKDRVVFKMSERIETLEPTIYLSLAPQDVKILGVGHDIVITEPHSKIRLFQSDPPPKHQIKVQFLTQFLIHGIKEVFSQAAFIRHRVIIYNVESLAGVMSGYEPSIFQIAVIKAGARFVLFR